MAKKILVLSTTNSTLGPMASGFLDYYSSKKTKVVGVGLEPQPIHEMALKVMDSVGMPPPHKTYTLNELEEVTFDFIVTFSEKARLYAEQHFLNAQRFHLVMDNLDNQTGDQKAVKKAFKAARKELQSYCADFIETHLEKKNPTPVAKS